MVEAFHHLEYVIFMGFYSPRSLNRDNLRHSVAEHMYAATAGEDGWRAPVSDCTGPRPNQIIWPPQTSDKFNFVDV